MKETPILKRILLHCGHGATRLFRRNVGRGWIGESVRLPNGNVLIKNARPFHSGFEGQSDLDGWHSIIITPEMIGRKLAIYTAMEVKTATGRVKKSQAKHIELVLAAGGIAGVVRSPEDAEELLNEI